MFKRFLKNNNVRGYRIQQLYDQYFKQVISSWDELTNWPKDLREKLKEEVPFTELDDFTEFPSSDHKTIKVLANTKEGFPVESVLMRNKDRITVCISCMSGCPVGCKFCATGRMGLNKSLSTHEIMDQIMYFQRKLKATGEKITNIVYMGMGEPLLNLKNVSESIDLLTDSNVMAMSARRVTVSTSGYIPQLEEFLKKDMGVNLAISLHAPNQKLREKLMPTVAKLNPLDKLMEVLIKDQKKRNKKITYEYLMLKDVTDTPECAKELAKLLKNQIVLVNLINFNKVNGISYEPSTRKRIEAFQTILDSRGITNTLRYSYGSDIKGACGQLTSIS
ncbi:23S rRNA (adenine(2503)-C(2))-methyltransferase RlmN [Patescibacteria group bacterium]|nr:23S rRNA (adenine(2503)-C(2))-methyltransferase RlmN [Patescibacteria group bacterium]